MNEQLFWEIIEKTKSPLHSNFETQCVLISEALLEYTPEDIITFEHILRQQLERANTFHMMAASFVVCSFLSDETYEDFRAWCIGQGKNTFEKILKDSSEICNILKPGQVKAMGGEHLLFSAINAYLEKTDTEGEEAEIAFYDKIPVVEEKEIEQKWPESKNDFRKMFPRLFDTFWNEDRIREQLEAAEARGEEI
jgi:hypothetical protein